VNGKSTGSRIYQLGIASLLGMGGAIATEQISIAQSLIVPDNTLGEEKSRLTPNVEIRGRLSDRISGGARRGGNLFHSFEQFEVLEGRGAYFENPSDVQNIFSRVTGSNPSEINGTLGVIREDSSTALGDANLFFINPNGIVFGENARLDVGGSFTATTAEAIEFAEQGVFSSSNPTVPELLTINPSAFLFNQISAQPITQYGSSDGANPINAGLRVPIGANLVLLGGN
jgi:filamentous hemagglutinin family protein